MKITKEIKKAIRTIANWESYKGVSIYDFEKAHDFLATKRIYQHFTKFYLMPKNFVWTKGTPKGEVICTFKYEYDLEGFCRKCTPIYS